MRNIQVVILVLICIINKGRTICSPEYGGEPCRFIPALPGKTPACARPGLTYCEHPDHYPARLILYLVEKWVFNHKTLLSNESPDDFSAYSTPSHFSYLPNSLYEHHNAYEPSYTSRPHYPEHHHSTLNVYLPPSVQPEQNYTEFQGYPDTRPDNPFYEEPPRNIRYNFNVQQSYNPHAQQSRLHTYTAVSPPQVTYYNPNEWWKRNARNPNRNQSFITKRRKRSLRKATPVNESFNNTDIRRIKRQTAPRGQSLCESRSQYIMPRAALNNKGNWMYVVNMPDNNRYTQLVKSETCISQQCNGLCTLPTGYTSRCEQKYIQKRLVALEGSGDQLYTDVFWFPSCCVCTINNN